jgi:hypothetical protein
VSRWRGSTEWMLSLLKARLASTSLTLGITWTSRACRHIQASLNLSEGRAIEASCSIRCVLSQTCTRPTAVSCNTWAPRRESRSLRRRHLNLALIHGIPSTATQHFRRVVTPSFPKEQEAGCNGTDSEEHAEGDEQAPDSHELIANCLS